MDSVDLAQQEIVAVARAQSFVEKFVSDAQAKDPSLRPAPFVEPALQPRRLIAPMLVIETTEPIEGIE